MFFLNSLVLSWACLNMDIQSRSWISFMLVKHLFEFLLFHKKSAIYFSCVQKIFSLFKKNILALECKLKFDVVSNLFVWLFVWLFVCLFVCLFVSCFKLTSTLRIALLICRRLLSRLRAAKYAQHPRPLIRKGFLSCHDRFYLQVVLGTKELD